MSDDFVVSKLKEWGLEKYTEEFRAKGIGQAALSFLNDKYVEQLVPAFGDQVVFKHYLHQFQSNNNSIIADSLMVSEDIVLDGNSVVVASVPLEIETVTPSTSSRPSQVDVDALLSIIKLSGYASALLLLKRRLRTKERRELCRHIVLYHTRDDVHQKIPHTQFAEWAELLSAIFPKDPKHLWFQPRTTVGNKKVVANGAILQAYYSARRDVGEVNDESASDNSDEDDVTEPLPDSVLTDVDWLSSHLEPWTTVQDKWRNTAEARKATRGNKRYCPTAYLEQYKVLRQPLGHLLVQSDFDLLFEDKANKLFDNIESFIEKAYLELKNVRPCPRELKSVLRQQEVTLKATGKLSTNAILMNLCYLVPVYTVTKKKQKKTDGVVEEIRGWRPTRIEVQNGFITHIDDVSKLQETVNRRDKRLLEVKQTRQPFVVIVGRDLDSITACYVCINDFFYLLNSPLEALDICFKTVFSLAMKYSIESRPLWLLLQTLVYEIFTPNDKASATHSAVSLLAMFDITLQ